MSDRTRTSVNITIDTQKKGDRPCLSIKKKYREKPLHNVTGAGINGNTILKKLKTKLVMMSNQMKNVNENTYLHKVNYIHSY